MRCQRIPGLGFVCGAPRPARCSVPGCTKEHVALCDWKLKAPARRKTCSAKLCADHTTKPAPDKDLCPAHVEAWKRWKAEHPKEGSP
jgi:hypothetical protein